MTPNVTIDVKANLGGAVRFRLAQLRPIADVARQWMLPTLSFLFIVFWTLRLFGVGATARCMDNTFSYNLPQWGQTCSWHGGVFEWFW